MALPSTDGLPITVPSFTIAQGSQFTKAWRWQTTADGGVTVVDVNLSACKARMQIRPRAGANPAYLTFSSDPADLADGTITLAADGTITVSLDGSHGAPLQGITKGVADLLIEFTPGDPTTRVKLFDTAVVIDPQITDSVAP